RSCTTTSRASELSDSSLAVISSGGSPATLPWLRDSLALRLTEREKVVGETRRRNASHATELDSEPERQALALAAWAPAQRWPGSELRPSPNPELRAPGQDRRRRQPIPRRLSPERLGLGQALGGVLGEAVAHPAHGEYQLRVLRIALHLLA